MKQIYILLICVLLFSCNEKVNEMDNTDMTNVVESLTENSFGGHSFESLLDASGAKPTTIMGGKVKYYEGSNAYVPDATKQVQIQLSKLGLNVPAELVLNKVSKFSGLETDIEFGQYDLYWNSEKNKCYISVHSEDDILEISCWY